jgi:putative acetyltransferase
MTRIKVVRSDSANVDFRELVILLDRDLAVRDGDEHAFYAAYNKIDALATVVLAFEHEYAVGCGAFKKYTDQVAEIKRMFVRPEYRGQGIAAKVLVELEDWAVELGYSETILETGKKQPEAIRLYQKSGYLVVPNFGQYQGVDNSVCMKKLLGPTP